MAQIVNRGKNKYLVRVFLGRKPGSSRYLDKVIHGNKKAAIKYATETETKRDLGLLNQPEPPEPYDPLLKDYLDGWFGDFKRPSIREQTADSYETVLKLYLKPYLGEHKLSALTARIVQEAYNKLGQDGYSPRTITYTHSLLKEALDQAVVDGAIIANPALSTRRPPRRKPTIEVFTPKEAETFVAAAQKDSLGIVLCFALATGPRPEEHLALKWGDVDFAKCQFRIERTLFQIKKSKGGGWRFEDVKTGSSRRTVEFNPQLRDALQRHKRQQAARRLKAGAKYHDHDLVFAGRNGEPLHYRNLTHRHLQPVLTAAKIGGPASLYRLRHSFATLSLLAGVDAKTVSEALGHSSVAFTLDTYAHVLPKMRKDAARKIGQLLFKSV